MTSLRLLSSIIVKNPLLHNDASIVKRALFLGATLNGRASRSRVTSAKQMLNKPFMTPIIDLENNPRESFEEASKVDEESDYETVDEVTQPPKVSKKVEPPLPFSFVRLEKNDRRLSDIMVIVKSKKYRKEANVIMLEGKRLIEDALLAGVKPQCFFFSRAEEMVKINVPTGEDAVPIFKVSYKELKLWSDLVTCPGVIGIFNVPVPNIIHPPEEAMPLTIICDNIRDPGNLGSILRVAAGVGSSKVILTKGCCEMWDSKVLRAAAGAHFRIPIESRVEWSDLHSHLSAFNHVFLADNHEKLALDDQNSSSHDTENRQESDSEDEEEEEYEQSQKDVEMNLLRESFSNSMPYFKVDFIKKSPMVLIIGGETHGVSIEALKFARLQDSCSRLHIPLFNSVESLNNGIALSIIAYEMQRQYILHNLSSDNDKSCSNEEICGQS